MDRRSAVSQVGDLRDGGESIGLAKSALHSSRTSADRPSASRLGYDKRCLKKAIVRSQASCAFFSS